MAQGKDAEKPLPKPNVVAAMSGTPPQELTAEAVKGILVNPIYAGVGPFPPIVTDQDWIRACSRMIKEDGAEQFLVNLLYVLRESLNQDLLRQVRDSAPSGKGNKSIVVGPPQANAPRLASEMPERRDDERQIGENP